MKTFLLAALAAVSAAMMPAAAQVAPTVYGNLIYTGSWGDEDATNAGVYSFAASADGPMELVYKPADNNVYANGGAVYADGRYYVLTRVPNSGKAQKNTLYVYDTDTWALVERRDAPLTLSASDLTWCPVDGKIYGVFLNATASGYDFGTLSLADLSVDVIKPLDLADKIGPMPMLGLAADTEGDVYGVGSDGNLYRFDRASGDYTLVGPTGFTPSRWNMSACFDFTTKEMYWAGCNLDRSALFRIDTATGEATAVREFADDEEFVGLYTLSSVADLDGPQAPEAFTVALDGPSTSARISFTLPSTAINGTALDGPLEYTVTSNGTLLFQGSGAPGEAISRDIALAEGLHAIEARCATAAGSRGASVRRTVYAGIDAPAAPASASAEKAGDAVAITWAPVTSGANNGYIDPATLTYTVTRMPDAATVASGITATSCTDTSLPAALADYTYEVRATASGKTGNPAVTPKLTLGYAVTPPVAYDLTDEEQFKFFTVDDANADGSTWKWSANGAVCNYNRNNASDDWLFSPSLTLRGGCQYTLTLEMRAGNTRAPETFRIMAGASASPEAMTTAIVPDGSTADNTRHTLTVVFTPDADGTYNIGLQCTSPKYQYNLYVYTFEVSAGVSLKAPVASPEVVAEAAAEGALQATVKAAVPAEAVDGTALAALTKAEVTNLTTSRLVATVEAPAPSSEISVTDTEAANGINRYSVVFHNAYGAGYAATAETYVGEDTPMAVTDVVLRQDGDRAVLTWSAPTEGRNGGYISAANLRYRVARVANGADAATALTSCEFTDTELDASVQTALQYTVYASNVAGESTGCNSNMLIFGSAYPVPFAESFAGGKASTAPWTTVRGSDSGYPEWSASTKSIYDTADSSQDADLGWMKYSSKGTITLQSPVVDIASAANPALKFWYRTADSSGDAVALDVLISPDRGVTFESVASITATSPEWTLRTVDLAAFRGYASLQVAFKASTQQYQDLLLDNIRITDVCSSDLAITAFTGAADPVAGTEAVYTVRVANNGLAPASGYEVTIAASGIELASVQGDEIAPDATASIDIPVTIPVNLADATLTATIDFDADQNTADNAATLTITVRAPRLPAIDGLAAACEDGAVRLTWPRAADDRAPSAMTDDLETLTAWDFGGVNATNAHGTIGDYKIYDADGQATVVASSWLTQPNGGQPMAFQVNRNGASYPEVDLKSYNINSFSGSTSLIAWGSAEGASSDWLILPELYPGETAISFRAHATPMGWGASPAEKLDVLYSATTDAIDAFTPFVTAVDVPAGTEYDADKGFALFSYTLPADARYAAVRVSLSTTQNKAVVIDDITFTPVSAPREALEIEGYNIYRDGVLIAATADETYLDADAAEGTHTYNVTTRYTIGESLFSNPADASVTGLPVGPTANDTTVEYYTIQGIRLPGAPTAPGIYIRRTGSKAEKVRY